MTISFTKYHGTGNDFIMIDCTHQENFELTSQQISKLCHRRFGIGADGVILIFSDKELNFRMRYFNADGTKSFCGNGARCAVKFAQSIGLVDKTAVFSAIDGIHEASIEGEEIALKMNDVNEIQKTDEAYIIDTGSPHFILFKDDIEEIDVVEIGRKIRYSETYKEKGINVNVVEINSQNQLKIRTYERGVEDETYSCGTGATAVALAVAEQNNQTIVNSEIQVKGGLLHVKAAKNEFGYTSIYLIGPAKEVFNGTIRI